MTNKDVTGIILSLQDYKEKDALVSILCEDEIITFVARGVHKANAKNRLLIRPFTKVTVSLTGKGMPVLTTGHVEQSYLNIYDDLVIQAVLNVLVDCIRKTTIQPIFLEMFEHCLHSFHTGESNAYTYACIVLKEVLKEEGISIYVDGCVSCHRKDHIETISIEDGGFICSVCNHGRIRKYAKEELIMYRSLFVYKYDQTEKFVDLYSFKLDDFMFLVRWFMNYTNYNLHSYHFLQSIMNL